MPESRTAHRVLDGVTALVRRWRIIVPFAVVTPLVVFALTRATPATYESSANVLIDRKGYAISDLRDQEWYSYDASRAIKTQVSLARLPEIEGRVYAAAEREGLSASGLFGRSAVLEDGLTDLMTFSVRDGDPDAATGLATIYAEQFVAHRRALDTRAFRRALAVVNGQVARARATGVDPSTYADLVKQQQQLQTGLAAVSANTRLVSAGDDATRVAPLLTHDTVLALVLGLIVGLGLAGLASQLDTRARTVAEISDQIGLPIIGRLPFEGGRASSRRSLVVLRRSDSPGAEAVRVLRANLELGGLSRDRSVVMVTSAVAGEGKSTTVANLAAALALAGRDVVLIDLDLRRPVISRIFDLPTAPGITELVRGQAEIAEVVRPVPLAGADQDGDASAPSDSAGHGALFVVPAGNTLATEIESTITGRGLAMALQSLRELADVVLVDSPPLLQTGDTLALSSHVDGLVLVAQARRYRRSYAPELRRWLTLASSTPLGLVIVGRPNELEPASHRLGERRHLDIETVGHA